MCSWCISLRILENLAISEALTLKRNTKQTYSVALPHVEGPFRFALQRGASDTPHDMSGTNISEHDLYSETAIKNFIQLLCFDCTNLWSLMIYVIWNEV